MLKRKTPTSLQKRGSTLPPHPHLPSPLFRQLPAAALSECAQSLPRQHVDNFPAACSSFLGSLCECAQKGRGASERCGETGPVVRQQEYSLSPLPTVPHSFVSRWRTSPLTRRGSSGQSIGCLWRSHHSMKHFPSPALVYCTNGRDIWSTCQTRQPVVVLAVSVHVHLSWISYKPTCKKLIIDFYTSTYL